MDQILRKCAAGNAVKASTSARTARIDSAAFAEALGEGVGVFVPVGLDLGFGGEREDRPERGGDHLDVCLRDGGEQVAGVVHPAALPRRASEALGDRRLPERVKGDETTSYADWMSASRLGSLIQATSGSFGGVGGW